jgi:hypothetical protein
VTPRAAAAAAAACAALAAGCGTESADLFVVERAGELPDARLTLVVGDGTSVDCDGRERPLSNEHLLDARQLAADLEPLLERRTRLPVPETALLRFRVFNDAGEVRFADASPRLPPELGRVIALTRAIAMASCGRDR